MSVQKKSLISDEKAAKKAPSASQPTEVPASPLKAHSLTAHSMVRRKSAMAHRAYKTASFKR